MVAPAAPGPPGFASPPSFASQAPAAAPAAGGEVLPEATQGQALGVPVFAAPTPWGTALVVPPAVLSLLNDAGHVLASGTAPVRVDLLAPDPEAQRSAAVAEEAVSVARRAVAGATLAPDPALGRLERIGPAGLWYACLLVWGGLLLLFAADVPAQVAGALWLVAGLPLARRAYRRRLRAWGRRGAAGWHPIADPLGVRPAAHAGLVELERVIGAQGDDPAGACRAAAQACPRLGLSGLAPFYAALAAGSTPGGVWSRLAPLEPEVPAPLEVPPEAPPETSAILEVPAPPEAVAPPEAAAPPEAPAPQDSAPSPQEAPEAPAPADPIPASETPPLPAPGEAGGETPRTSSTPI